MSSPLPPEPGLAARSVVAADMMPTRGSILAPVEHLGHGLASRPALWLRFCLCFWLRLWLSLGSVFPRFRSDCNSVYSCGGIALRTGMS